MRFLLDSNVCIRYLNVRSERLISKMDAVLRSEIALCSVVKAELFYGAMQSDRKEETLRRLNVFFETFVSLPFDDAASFIFGKIRAELARRGAPIGPYDLQIAAIALANDLTLVTHNMHEFSRVRSLKLIDWEQ